jgi:ADP-dependent phosphofructokinase/glucokinase
MIRAAGVIEGEHIWAQLYARASEAVEEIVLEAPPILAGFTACVDVVIAFDDALLARLQADSTEGGPARELVDELARAVVRGGGELRLDWPEGPAWLGQRLAGTRALGGTGAQVAQSLAVLGAQALLCLGKRSSELADLLDPNVLLASDSGAVAAAHMATSGNASLPHYVFEFARGATVDGRRVTKSDRLITLYEPEELEDDPQFDHLSSEIAALRGAAVISGFNELLPERRRAGLARCAALVETWRRRGLRVAHVELARYPDNAAIDEVCSALAPACNSVGMNDAEFRTLTGTNVSAERAAMFAEHYGFTRICIHGDRWAYSLTRDDPDVELGALLVGSLLAASRAHLGRPASRGELLLQLAPVAPVAGSPGSRARLDGWTEVICPTPHIRHPVATVGLGDTFTAGALLALGTHARLSIAHT